MANALGSAMKAARKKKSGININPAHKGQLHRALGVPEGQKIPASKIAAATNSSSPDLRRKAQFAQNAAKFKR